jgi:membrane protein required for colicin V production
MLNAADVALLAVIALSCVVGLWRGFLVEVMSLAVWAAAFWLAFSHGEAASTMFAGAVAAAPARLFLGYATLFIGALVTGGLATWLIGKLVKSTGLSGTDRLLGLGFGALRGAALCCVAVLVLGFTPLPQDPWWSGSRLLPSFTAGAQWMRGWLPEAVASHVRFEALPNVPALPETSPLPATPQE